MTPAFSSRAKVSGRAPNSLASSAIVSVAALLERGNIRRLKGDIPGARQDWLRVAKLAPGSAEEAAAKANIERLDVKDEPAPAATPGPRQ